MNSWKKKIWKLNLENLTAKKTFQNNWPKPIRKPNSRLKDAFKLAPGLFVCISPNCTVNKIRLKAINRAILTSQGSRKTWRSWKDILQSFTAIFYRALEVTNLLLLNLLTRVATTVKLQWTIKPKCNHIL